MNVALGLVALLALSIAGALWASRPPQLEPKDGHCIVTRKGKQHYRRLPKADQVTE